MGDRPILFSAPMIKALLAGTKSQDRRILKAQPQGGIHPIKHLIRPFDAGPFYQWRWHSKFGANLEDIRTPISIGDRLWCKETWAPVSALKHNDPGTQALIDRCFYRADGSVHDDEIDRWRPSIFMPRVRSRITLLVDDVRVERLQDISEEDAMAEGITRIGAEYIARGSKDWDRGPNFYTIDIDGVSMNDATAVDVYRRLWEWINGEGSWQSNPFVVAYAFRVVIENIDYIGKAAA